MPTITNISNSTYSFCYVRVQSVIQKIIAIDTLQHTTKLSRAPAVALQLAQRRMRRAIRLIRELMARDDKRRRRAVMAVPQQCDEDYDGDTDESYETACEEQCYEPGVKDLVLLHNIFPYEIDLVYERRSTSKGRAEADKSALERYAVASRKTTSFFDLPRELRDEIYQYAILADTTIKIRFHPNGNKRPYTPQNHRPLLYRALPLLGEEILETYYKQNTFRLVATHDYSVQMAGEWIRRCSPLFIKCIRSLQISHAIGTSGLACFWPGSVATTVTLNPDKSITVRTTYQRPRDGCVCDVQALVQDRLSQDDALGDPDCIRRVEESTQFGPILGFGLQILEAVRLAENHQKGLRAMPYDQRQEVYKCMPTNCHMCGGQKWGFQYCSMVGRLGFL